MEVNASIFSSRRIVFQTVNCGAGVRSEGGGAEGVKQRLSCGCWSLRLENDDCFCLNGSWKSSCMSGCSRLGRLDGNTEVGCWHAKWILGQYFKVRDVQRNHGNKELLLYFTPTFRKINHPWSACSHRLMLSFLFCFCFLISQKWKCQVYLSVLSKETKALKP